MKKDEVVLAAMAPAKGKPHSPVQVQKLLFLLDREAKNLVGGPHFNFVPYNYGPFDKEVYQILRKLDEQGMITIRSEGSLRTYALTPAGQEDGDRILKKLSNQARDYINSVSAFVQKLTFMQLVSSIYQQYPDMRENSVLRQP